MSLAQLEAAQAAGRMRVPIGAPQSDRTLLLELAADLERWPTRNIVFRKALDRAAGELARMATQAP